MNGSSGCSFSHADCAAIIWLSGAGWPGFRSCVFSSRPRLMSSMMTDCAVRSLVPVFVCKSVTCSSTPRQAAVIWSHISFTVSSAVRGSPLCNILLQQTAQLCSELNQTHLIECSISILGFNHLVWATNLASPAREIPTSSYM